LGGCYHLHPPKNNVAFKYGFNSRKGKLTERGESKEKKYSNERLKRLN
jgi:hypothetical protein